MEIITLVTTFHLFQTLSWYRSLLAINVQKKNVFSTTKHIRHHGNLLIVPSIFNILAVETFSPLRGKLSHSSMIKLDQNNHLIGKLIIFPIIHGYKLDGYLLGTKPCPPKFLPATTMNNYLSLNLAYEDWLVHDQLLLGWLFSSINCVCYQSMANALNYWQQLQHTVKGSMSIDKYLTNMTGGVTEAILMTQESCIEQLNSINQVIANIATNQTDTNGKPCDHGTNFKNREQFVGNPLHGCKRYQEKDSENIYTQYHKNNSTIRSFELLKQLIST
ncbi:hypothetical protein ACOSP7_013418 [Xanthoceras sorbifolium]